MIDEFEYIFIYLLTNMLYSINRLFLPFTYRLYSSNRFIGILYIKCN